MFGQNPYMMPYQQPYYPAPMPDDLARLRTQQTPQMPSQPVTQPSSGIIWVQGEEGAKAYMVAAGNNVMLMDSEASTFYIKSTDQSGMPLPLRIFDYTERTAPAKSVPPQTPPAEYATREELEALSRRVEQLAGGERKEVSADVQPAF